MPQLDGRVFSRLAQFEALPDEFKNQVETLETHLTTIQNEVFAPHHANLIKSIRSVRNKVLLEKIDVYLLAQEAPHVADDGAAPVAAEEPVPAPVDAPVVEVSNETPAVVEGAAEAAPATAEETVKEETDKEKEAAAAAKAKEEAAAAKAKADEAAKAKAAADQAAKDARLALAKKLVEGLVLKGFLTPYKEQDKPATEEREAFTFKDSELFVPLATAVAGFTVPVTTVWDLVDGAIFAAALKRKAGFLAPLTQGKDVYAIVNGRTKTLTLFENDLGRQPLVALAVAETPTLNVAFDNTHFVHGVKVWHDTVTELLNAATKKEREALVHALLAIGVEYHEPLAPELAAVESIYALRDTDIDGKVVLLESYKGKVLLVVNVSSQCGLTPTNYPELQALYAKYQDRGLEILAFPCDQFAGQEPGTNEEIKAFATGEYGATYPLFSKGDVNGTQARPVFAYLKHKLPATYIQWNFTKFLVDRDGQPSKRFGPQELPLSFESEIVALLDKEATPAPVAVVAEAESKAEAEATEEKAPVGEAPGVAAAEPTEETKAAVPTEEVEAEVVAEATKAAVPAEEVKVEETKAPVAAEPEKAAVLSPKVTTLSVDEHPLPAATEEPAKTEEPAASQEPAKVEAVDAEAELKQGFTEGNDPTPTATASAP